MASPTSPSCKPMKSSRNAHYLFYRGGFVYKDDVGGPDGGGKKWSLVSDFDRYKEHSEALGGRMHVVKFTHLRHATGLEAGISISQQGFKPSLWRGMNLVYFSVIPSEGTVKQIRSDVGKEVRRYLWDSLHVEDSESLRELCNEIAQIPERKTSPSAVHTFCWNDEEIVHRLASSPAFRSDSSRYGNFAFDLEFNYLIECYKKSVACVEVSFYKLGTSVFAQEVQHAVLVAPSDKKFEDLDEFSPKEGGELIWRVLSSCHSAARLVASQKHDHHGHLFSHMSVAPNFWQCLSFAFFMPNAGTFLKVVLPSDSPTFVAIGCPNLCKNEEDCYDEAKEAKEKWEQSTQKATTGS